MNNSKHFADTICGKSPCLQAVYTVYLHLSTKLGAIRELLWSSFDRRTTVSAFGAVMWVDGFCFVGDKRCLSCCFYFMVGKIGISAQTSSTSVLFCCVASSNGWNSSICGPVAQSVQLSRKVSGLFQSCYCIPEISTHAPLACSWSAASGDKCSKMNVLEDPCSFTKLLSPETPMCWTIAKHS